MKIGTGELLLILGVALIVFGPSKLPQIGKFLGETLFATKKYLGELTEEINEEVKKPIEDIKKPIEDALKPIGELTKPLEDALKLPDTEKPAENAPEPQDTEAPVSEAAPVPEEPVAAAVGDTPAQPRRLLIKRSAG